MKKRHDKCSLFVINCIILALALKQTRAAPLMCKIDREPFLVFAQEYEKKDAGVCCCNDTPVGPWDCVVLCAAVGKLPNVTFVRCPCSKSSSHLNFINLQHCDKYGTVLDLN